MTASSPQRQLADSRAEPVSFTVSDGRSIVALRCTTDMPAIGVVLLLPGYTGTKEDFAPILDPLAGAGFEAVAADLPGQYQSAGPAHPAGYLPDALAADVVLVAGALRAERPDVPLHLLGHSYGGIVARATVLAAPAAFDSLVLLDSGPSGIGGNRRLLIDTLEPVLESYGVGAVWEASLAAARRDPRWSAPPPPLADFLRTRFLASSAVALRGYGDGIRSEPDRVADLAALGVATLVAYGEGDDAWTPRVQDEMAARLGAKRVVIPNAEHSPAIENPAALVGALLAFWRGL